ncbi:MAG: hypothetical protein WCS94_14190 [Verrucomicrobiota bacterium]
MKLNVIILAALWFLPALAGAAVTVTSETGNRHVPICLTRIAASYLKALGALESGNNDLARGKAGEVGRYQCLKSVWRLEGGSQTALATDSATAAAVVVKVVRGRTGKEIAMLSPEEFARAWHCPGARRLNREQRDYVARFVNLMQSTSTQ